jgi:hypothetical protein
LAEPTDAASIVTSACTEFLVYAFFAACAFFRACAFFSICAFLPAASC